MNYVTNYNTRHVVRLGCDMNTLFSVELQTHEYGKDLVISISGAHNTDSEAQFRINSPITKKSIQSIIDCFEKVKELLDG